mmetsp:Transcript_30608/g.79897  ORF Transcript_30608/g.79897 Transcript_30608/m.79897 type:complete len:95 (+) Transcript_30608:2153-2437(+)
MLHIHTYTVYTLHRYTHIIVDIMAASRLSAPTSAMDDTILRSKMIGTHIHAFSLPGSTRIYYLSIYLFVTHSHIFMHGQYHPSFSLPYRSGAVR